MDNKPFNGAEVVAVFPRVTGGPDKWVVAQHHEFEYVAFWATDMTAPTWGQGHYFLQDREAALRWAAEQAGYVGSKEEDEEMRPQVEAAAHFLNVCSEVIGSLPGDYSCYLTCYEAESLAELYRAFGDDGKADDVIEGHAEGDEHGEKHCRCEECVPTVDCPGCPSEQEMAASRAAWTAFNREVSEAEVDYVRKRPGPGPWNESWFTSEEHRALLARKPQMLYSGCPTCNYKGRVPAPQGLVTV
jgi:hypothetical protein